MIIKHDLGQLADELGAAHPQIEALYLFGSRRHQTKSVRSDVDVLVLVTDHIKPSELRDFTDAHCPALDLFVLREGKATSCQNDSYIEAGSTSELIAKLDAVRFWQRNGGRQTADISWLIEIRDDVEFVATVLPNRAFPSKRKSPDEMTLGDWIKELTVKQLAAIVGICAAALVSAFTLGAFSSRLFDATGQNSAAPPRAAEPVDANAGVKN